MKAFFALAIYAVLVFTSCSNNSEAGFPLTQKIAVADKAIVKFTGGKTVEFDAQKTSELNILKQAVGKNELEHLKCAPQGIVTFYKAGMALDSFEFSAAEDCSYLRFALKNELHFTDINAAAKQLLKSTAAN